MATVRKEIQTRACPAEAWAAIRDIGRCTRGWSPVS